MIPRQSLIVRDNAQAVVVVDGARVLLREETNSHGLVTRTDRTFADAAAADREEAKILARRAKIGWQVDRRVESRWAAWPLEMERVAAAAWGHADDICDSARRSVTLRPPQRWSYDWPPTWRELADVTSHVRLFFALQRGPLSTRVQFDLQLLAGGVGWSASTDTTQLAGGTVGPSGSMTSSVGRERLVHDTADAFAAWYGAWVIERMDWIVADLR